MAVGPVKYNIAHFCQLLREIKGLRAISRTFFTPVTAGELTPRGRDCINNMMM